MSSRKTKILIVGSIVGLVLLIIGGVFWLKKGKGLPKNQNSDASSNNKPNSPQPNNPPPSDTPPPLDNSDKSKIELKVFWAGSLSVVNQDWEDYWVFSEAKEGKWMHPTNKRFLIAKNTPVLVDKDLWQENLLFNLAYSQKKGSKVEKADKDGDPILTIVESNFTLTPFSPTKNDPDFRNRWENTKAKELYFDYSKYSGGDYIFIDNQIQGGREEKDCDKFVFHPDNPSIKKLLARNLLQNQPKRNDKEFRVFYMERDIEKYIFLGNSRILYLNNQAKIARATN